MLRLPTQKALKAPLRSLFRNSLRNLPPNPPYGSLQVRHLHDSAVPFSGPPSYATLARRFSSSNPSPIGFFVRKDAKEAIERGEFVDIHDIGGVDPKDYDVLLTDVNQRTLDTEFSKLAGIPYLTETTKEEADKVAEEIHGFLYGQKFRMILPCILCYEEKARWVFFIVDTGAPLTYISPKVAQAIGVDIEDDPWILKIAGISHPVHITPPDSHFSEVNILGNDFLTRHRILSLVGDNRRVTYYIGKNWEVSRKQVR